MGSPASLGGPRHFLLHEQYTVLDEGEYFCITYIETENDRNPYAITMGTTAQHARHFRGSETLRREHARSKDIEPDPRLARDWEGVAWPSAAGAQPRAVGPAALAASFLPFPGIDLLDVYRFLDRRKRR